MQNKKLEGVVALIWLTISTVLEIITGLAFLIWKTKIALFFLSAQTVLWILMILMFWLWKRSLKKSL